MRMMQGTKKTAFILLALSLLVVVAVTPDFRRMHVEEPIRKGPGVTTVKQLSDYFVKLKGTSGDTAGICAGQWQAGRYGVGSGRHSSQRTLLDF
jgi:hypothetical protein